MPRPVHFEIPVDNLDRAQNFFGKIFGWTFQKWDGPMPYVLITTGPNEQPGINGGMMLKNDPKQPVVNTIGVENLDATMAAIQANGGAIVVPKMPIPGVGWLAYFTDTEGNIHGVMQPDTAAK